MTNATPPLEAPRDLRWLTPRYEFVRELGRGMAVVYLARERPGVSDEPGREVAVKVIAPPHAADRETAERFAREARTATALRHPNIVRTLAIETEGDAVAIVTEYIAGETLRTMLQTQGALPFDRAAAILRDVAAALAHAHAARIVHRDVKPENIFIERGTGRALLGDFGIARPIDADALLTHDGASLGTPAYMAPEQVDGLPVDARTDVYALGLVGWEMLTGRRPWQGETLYGLLQKQKHEALPDLARLRPDVPLYLHRAIEGALAKDPRGRWPDAGAMLAQLSPAPEALPEAEARDDGALTDRVQLEVASGTTVRFTTGDVDALRPEDWPVERVERTERMGAAKAEPPLVGISREEYLREEAELARLDAARARSGRAPGRARRWVAAAVLAAATAAAAATAVARRGDPSSSGDRQLDSLLAQTAQPARGTPAGQRDSVLDAARRPRPAGVRRAVTPPPAATPSVTAPATAPLTKPLSATPPRDSARRDTSNGEVASAADAAADAPPAAAAPDPAAAAAPARSTVHEACRSATNVDQRRCLMGLIYRNDADLNARYQVLINALRRQAGGASEPAAVHALRVEQRAWVDARDAACARQVPLSHNPHWGVARAPCFAGFSKRRAAVLSARLRGKLPQAQ